MAVGARLRACLARRARSAWQVPSSLYSTVDGAAGHNRGGVVERRLPARTQGRTVDKVLTCRFNTCTRCVFQVTPGVRPSQELAGTTPRTGQAPVFFNLV